MDPNIWIQEALSTTADNLHKKREKILLFLLLNRDPKALCHHILKGGFSLPSTF